MNKGNIPGFYYDTEKKKYFKIQANHVVPPAAKYSEGSVKQEKRKAKKRKTDERKQKSRLKQIVKRNSLLEHPVLGGAGVSRELGTSATVAYADAIDCALVAGWRYRTAKVKATEQGSFIRMSNACYLPSMHQMIIGGGYGDRDYSLVTTASFGWGRSEHLDLTLRGDIAYFAYPVQSINATVQGDVARALICASGERGTCVYMVSVAAVNSDDAAAFDMAGVSLDFGLQQRRHALAAAFQHQTGKAAIIGGDRVMLVNEDINPSTVLPIWTAFGFSRTSVLPENGPEFGAAIDWFDPNIVAFAATEPAKHRVMLWDTRSPSGTSMRFNTSERVTGVLNPANDASGRHGHQLYISTNHSIGIFDTRMPHSASTLDRSVLNFSHVHQGPVLHFAASNGMFAAVDRDNLVQVYSSRTGRTLRSMEVPDEPARSHWHGNMTRDLMWYEEAEMGLCLQACRGNDITRWVWEDGAE